MSRSIRLVFSGGLGNQLFQYALYLYLKKMNSDAEIIPDLRAYRYDAYHFGFEVQKLFNVDFAETISTTENYRLKKNTKQPEIARIARILWLKICGYKTIYDSTVNTPQILDEVLSKYKRVVLAGFFQNPTFINEIATDLRKNFDSEVDLGEECRHILEQVHGRTTISLHIRRGDYLNIPAYNVFNGLDYYKRAVKYFKGVIESPLFMIFTNDPEWVADNLHIDADSIAVTCNKGSNSYRDLIMMSKCDHNIIANSSFSWWGAWLNPNPQKIVICPAEWFKGKMSSEVVPQSWIKIEN